MQIGMGRSRPAGQISRVALLGLIAILALLGLVLCLAGCDAETVTDTGVPPAGTTVTGNLTQVIHWHGTPGQSCQSSCGSGRVHSPWKLSYQCPADPQGVGGYGLAFQLSSSDGSTSQVDAPTSCEQGQVVWWDDYSQMPSVGSGATLTITEVDCPDPRPFGAAANPAVCDLWIWQG